MQGNQIKSKEFSEIMDNYFPEWKDESQLEIDTGGVLKV